jgi:hypothetical protein
LAGEGISEIPECTIHLELIFIAHVSDKVSALSGEIEEYEVMMHVPRWGSGDRCYQNVRKVDLGVFPRRRHRNLFPHRDHSGESLVQYAVFYHADKFFLVCFCHVLFFFNPPAAHIGHRTSRQAEG